MNQTKQEDQPSSWSSSQTVCSLPLSFDTSWLVGPGCDIGPQGRPFTRNSTCTCDAFTDAACDGLQRAAGGRRGAFEDSDDGTSGWCWFSTQRPSNDDPDPTRSGLAHFKGPVCIFCCFTWSGSASGSVFFIFLLLILNIIMFISVVFHVERSWNSNKEKNGVWFFKTWIRTGSAANQWSPSFSQRLGSLCCHQATNALYGTTPSPPHQAGLLFVVLGEPAGLRQ